MRKRHEAPLSLSQRAGRFLFSSHSALYIIVWLLCVSDQINLIRSGIDPNFLLMWTPILIAHIYQQRKEPSASDSIEAYREGFRDAAEMLMRREASQASLGRLAMSEDGELSDEWIDHVSGKIKRG